MVATIEYRRRNGGNQTPLVIIHRAHVAATAANKNRTPMNRMIGLVQNHWTRHHQRIFDDTFFRIFRRIYLHIITFVRACNRMHTLATAWTATNEIRENSNRTMRPIVVLNDLRKKREMYIETKCHTKNKNELFPRRKWQMQHCKLFDAERQPRQCRCARIPLYVCRMFRP